MIFGEKLLKIRVKCVFWFSLQICPKHFSFKEKFSEISSMCTRLHVKHTLLLSHFKDSWIFLDRFSEDMKISNFTKIRPARADWFHTHGWTDGHKWWSLTLILLTWSTGWAPNNARKWQMGFNLAFKGLIVPFSNFANGPKNSIAPVALYWSLFKRNGRDWQLLYNNVEKIMFWPTQNKRRTK